MEGRKKWEKMKRPVARVGYVKSGGDSVRRRTTVEIERADSSTGWREEKSLS